MHIFSPYAGQTLLSVKCNLLMLFRARWNGFVIAGRIHLNTHQPPRFPRPLAPTPPLQTPPMRFSSNVIEMNVEPRCVNLVRFEPILSSIMGEYQRDCVHCIRLIRTS